MLFVCLNLLAGGVRAFAGGYILPRQKPETTTTAARKNPFEVLIAMSKLCYASFIAKTHFFFDSILFSNICQKFDKVGIFFSSLHNDELICPGYHSNGSPQTSTGIFYWDDGISVIDDIQNHNYYQWSMSFVVNDNNATLRIQRIKNAVRYFCEAFRKCFLDAYP